MWLLPFFIGLRILSWSFNAIQHYYCPSKFCFCFWLALFSCQYLDSIFSNILKYSLVEFENHFLYLKLNCYILLKCYCQCHLSWTTNGQNDLINISVIYYFILMLNRNCGRNILNLVLRTVVQVNLSGGLSLSY